MDARSAIAEVRGTILSGIWLGALVGGVGGRLAMLVLRVLSPDSVHGLISDDGFFIGRVTLADTYSLIGVCAGIGVVGAAAYRWVAPWLMGPGWFRQTTCALGAGAVVGSLLIKPGGVDFTRLHPLGLAIAFFVLIPALFGFFIGPLQHALCRPEGWLDRGRRRWIAPIVSIVAFPPVLVVALPVAALTLIGIAAKEVPRYVTIRTNRVFGVVVRTGWLAAAIVGAVALAHDTNAIL